MATYEITTHEAGVGIELTGVANRRQELLTTRAGTAPAANDEPRFDDEHETRSLQ